MKLNLRRNSTDGDARVLHLVGNQGGSQAKITIKETGQLVALLDRERGGRKGAKNQITVRPAAAGS